MATEISPPTLKESTNYELWKLQTLAWTVVTDLSKEKQAVAVALNLPEGDKNNIKEKVFDGLKLDDLNSENGMSLLFQFLDKHLLEDDLMDSLNKFEDFENFERKHGQKIREYVNNFDLKYSKLAKLNIKIPSEIMAFKLLRNANISKQERMIVLTGVNLADKENMYKETKHSLLKFMGELTEGKARTGQGVKLEPAWRKFTSSTNKAGYIQRGNNGNGWMKKKLNPLGSDGRILLYNSCGSYRHLVAECQDSWENMAKKNASECNVKLRYNTDEDKLKGEETRDIEPLEFGETCSVPVVNKQLAGEMTQLKIEIRNLKTEIKEINGVKDKELKRQKEEHLSHEKILEGNDVQEKESDTTLQELFQSIMKLQGDLSRAINDMKETISTKESLSLNNQYGSETKEEEIKIWRDMEENKEIIKLLRKDDYAKQVSSKETRTEGSSSSSEGIHQDNGTKQRLLEKAKKVRQKLQMTQGKTKTISLISKNQKWFGWPVKRQQLYDMALQVIAGIWVSKLLHNSSVLNNI